MSEMTLVPHQPPVTQDISLEEMVAFANRAYHSGEQTAAETLRYWITAGTWLLECQKRVPRKEWMRWLAANFDGDRSQANASMRAANYRADIPVGLPFHRAMKAIAHLPRLNSPDEERVYAQALLAEGKSRVEIARILGVSKTTAWHWTDPEKYHHNKMRARARARRRSAERAALKRQERDRTMRKIGGAPDKAYSAIRKAAQEVDRAREDSDSGDVRRDLDDAYDLIAKAEDKIAHAYRAA